MSCAVSDSEYRDFYVASSPPPDSFLVSFSPFFFSSVFCLVACFVFLFFAVLIPWHVLGKATAATRVVLPSPCGVCMM